MIAGRLDIRALVITTLLVCGLAGGVRAAEPLYIGAKFCRTCHSGSDRERYHLWLESRHGKAFDSLVGARKTDPECLGCHTTGYGKPMSESTSERDLRGVQCEACHGPGSEYKSMRVMKDPDLARQNGLWDVNREVCLGCHR
ncbi:MAG: cytochrome c family protein [bacterium]|nr:MAG: cytochrome c family protein [bacterium]